MQSLPLAERRAKARQRRDEWYAYEETISEQEWDREPPREPDHEAERERFELLVDSAQ